VPSPGRKSSQGGLGEGRTHSIYTSINVGIATELLGFLHAILAYDECWTHHSHENPPRDHLMTRK